MNLQQYLHDNGLQREDILTRIAVSLELDETRKQRMESAYNAVYDILEKDELFFSKVDFLVYPQGSKAIGTTVKPRGKEEFDLDITVEIRDPYYNYTSSEIYNHLIRVLSNNDIYKEKLVKKNRCARIDYVGDFHMDVLPGCIVINGDSKIMVPDRELSSWTSSNPKGYANWFTQKAETISSSNLNKAFRTFSALNEAKAEQEELPNDDIYSKEPLKRAVQLTKRYRDIYFEKNPKHKTSSIVLTTIFGELYDGEPSIYQTIDSILNKIVKRYTDYQYLFESQGVYKRIKVLNPVNSDEDFTEKWDKEKEYYNQFIAFAKSYKEKWEKLKNGNFGVAEELFGSDRIKGILTEQLKELSKNEGNQLEAAGVTIMSGNTFVDKSGNVNNSTGYKSKENRNFGGIE
ncbi:nucleotidyltransferase [Lutibacter aestuarii]|uniref:Nucleotidyltransferase n=1 Tax=Lutibacter aestuarii TaxID=861111 RepID=A0ABW2Z8E4_9FLAO